MSLRGPSLPSWVALYREGDRLIGGLTVNGQTEIMKYRAMIQGRHVDEALAFAADRAAAHAAQMAAAVS